MRASLTSRRCKTSGSEVAGEMVPGLSANPTLGLLHACSSLRRHAHVMGSGEPIRRNNVCMVRGARILGCCILSVIASVIKANVCARTFTSVIVVSIPGYDRRCNCFPRILFCDGCAPRWCRCVDHSTKADRDNPGRVGPQAFAIARNYPYHAHRDS
jgi:hypothetical protein